MTSAVPTPSDDLQVLVHHQLVAALQEREHDLAESQRLARLGSWSWDIQTGLVTWSDELHRLFGIAPEDFEPCFEGFVASVHPDDRARVEAIVGAAMSSHEPYRVDHRVASTGRWVRGIGVVDLDPAGEVVRMHGIAQDVHEWVTVVSESAERAWRCAEIVGAPPARAVSLYRLDGTPAFSIDLAGPVPRDRSLGFEIFDRVHPDDIAAARQQFDLLLSHAQSTVEFPCRLQEEDGSWGDYELYGFDASSEPAVDGILLWSCERGADRPGLSTIPHAHLDPLTGVASHPLFVEQAEQVLARAGRYGWRVAIVAVDIDHFGEINEAKGHLAGDAVLIEVARRLAAAFRASDSVGHGRRPSIGRFGGGRFFVVCENVTGPTAAERLIERVRAILEPGVLAGDDEIVVRVCVGVGVDGPEGPGVEQRILDAEEALREAKAKGPGQAEVVDAEDVAPQRRSVAERALRRATDEHELTLYYQPKLSLESDRITGAEALLRWIDPTRGMVPPLDFVPLAEETGLIIPIGTWVIETACEQIATWQRDVPRQPPLTVSVNVSAVQFGPGLIDAVGRALATSGIDPGLLCLEVTESVLVDDAERAAATLAGLAALGVGLSIDDFGTGYSSLSYLKRFAVHELKIDRSFVSGLGDDTNDTAIVAATVAMAHALGLNVVAEGVETDDQLERLRVLGCQEAQGYLISRPQPVDQFDEFVTREASSGWRVIADDDDGPVQSYRPPRVLVVDDAADVRQLAHMTLTSAGFDVQQAATGAEAVVMARAGLPDCVVLDVSMPDMSGMDVCRVLRADPATRDCTIVMLTSMDAAEDKIEAFTGGADDYIVKPFSPRDLTSRVRAAVRRRAGDDDETTPGTSA